MKCFILLLTYRQLLPCFKIHLSFYVLWQGFPLFQSLFCHVKSECSKSALLNCSGVLLEPGVHIAVVEVSRCELLFKYDRFDSNPALLKIKNKKGSKLLPCFSHLSFH